MPNTAARNLHPSPRSRNTTGLPSTQVERGNAPFCVEDYVQLACTLRKSVRLFAVGADGSRAEVVVHRGELWSAADEQGGGSAAFRRLLGRPCVVQVEQLSEADRGPRNVFSNWEQLLLLAAMENTPSEAEPSSAPTASRGAERRSDPDAEVRVSGVRLALATSTMAGAPSADAEETMLGASAVSAATEQRPSASASDEATSMADAASAVEPAAEPNSPSTPSASELPWQRMRAATSNAKSSVKNWFSTPVRPAVDRPSVNSGYVREIQRGVRDTLTEVSTALTELKNRPDRRQAFLAAGICACLAVLWLNFIQGEFRRLSAPTTAASTAQR